MDSETRHLDPADAARVPGAPAPGPRASGAAPNGTPTTYLPPVTPGAVPPVGTTYQAPNGPAATNAPAGQPYEPAGPAPAPVYPPAAPRPAAAAWPRMGGRQNSWVPFLLILLGFWALFGGFRHVFGAAIPLALGLIFLYVSTQGPHRWGFRIPGAILTGLGAGIVVDAAGLGGGGGYSALGLGLGFVALWAWNRAQWWWLIPGAIISLGGLEGIMARDGWSNNYLMPLALVAFGAYLLSGRRWRTRP